MGLLLGTRRALIGGVGSYADKVLGTGPIAYWPLDETAGTAARCLVNPAQNGTATGVTWANDATGAFGTSAPYFDGANDYVNVLTAALQAAWSSAAGAEWALALWWRVANVGVWTDATWRKPCSFIVDANNVLNIAKTAADNLMWSEWYSGAVAESYVVPGCVDVGWRHMAVTHSTAADRVLWYEMGTLAQTDAALGVWASPAWAQMVIGAQDNAPTLPWHGWLAHCALWNRALSAGEIAALAAA